MQLKGYPDLLGFTQRSRTTSALKARMDVVSQEAVTGVSADLTKKTQGRVGGAHLLQKALNDLDQSSRITALSKTRLDLTASAINGARTAMNDIGVRGLVAAAAGNIVGVNAISDEAEANLRSVMSSFGARQSTRNLFSGGATDQSTFAPADDLLNDIKNIMATAGGPADIDAALDTYFNDPLGGFETNIYTGGDTPAPPLRLGSDATVQIDIRGNNQAIKDTLRGLAVLAAAPSSPDDPTSDNYKAVFQSGLDFASKGNSGLIVLEGNLGIYQETLSKAKDQNDFEQLTLSAAYQSLAGVDQFEAASELKQLEVALQSSFIITSRLSELSLTNYIR